MTQSRTVHSRSAFRYGWTFIFAVAVLLGHSAGAQITTLHLKNGDQLSGKVVSEDTSKVTLATDWAKKLQIPLDQIASRSVSNPPPAVVVAAAPPPKPEPQPPVKVVAKAAPTPKPPHKRYWKTDTQIGLDVLYSNVKSQTYFGQFKLGYQRPYEDDPRRSFRNDFAYNVAYGKTDGVVSDNRMSGSVSSELDFAKNLFAYSLMSVGYDKVRLIDRQCEIGPGLGLHLFHTPKFEANSTLGMNYQSRQLSDSTTEEDFYHRVGFNSNWRITDRVSVNDSLEYLIDIQDMSQYRGRAEVNLKYKLLENVSINFTVSDLYDTQSAPNVDQNEFRVRSSLGVTY